MTEIKNATRASNLSYTLSIGEESCASWVRAASIDDPTFCVNPIDGTINVVHVFPFCYISLCLIYQKRAVLGAVYNPFLDYLVRDLAVPPSPTLTSVQYKAIKCQGSYLTRGSGQPMKLPLAAPKLLPSLSQALIGVFPSSYTLHRLSR
ncbi:hypothetical protein OG21DRAFT_848819 [Imleria badia]|nr:hypothetical protein OG21DRAFT_848819 [Imleria badia]